MLRFILAISPNQSVNYSRSDMGKFSNSVVLAQSYSNYFFVKDLNNMLTELFNQILKIKKEALLKPHKIKSKQVISNYIQENPNRIKLNIGSGGSGIAGWLNGDIWFYEGTVYMDVAETLPFNNSSVQFIKTEHMIEHLEYATCKYFFQERT